MDKPRWVLAETVAGDFSIPLGMNVTQTYTLWPGYTLAEFTLPTHRIDELAAAHGIHYIGDVSDLYQYVPAEAQTLLAQLLGSTPASTQRIGDVLSQLTLLKGVDFEP